jgi:branched-chain amino acid transport system ATP-binding protein
MLREARRRPAGTLSGGQQQQLAIGRALVAKPRLLLLDEPSLGLAPTLVDGVFHALAHIREQGVTMLLVEQRAQRTVALADRTFVLANGELRMTLGPADADDTDKLVAAYLAG